MNFRQSRLDMMLEAMDTAETILKHEPRWGDNCEWCGRIRKFKVKCKCELNVEAKMIARRLKCTEKN